MSDNITIKSNSEIENMRIANKIIANMLEYLETKVKPGITTATLNEEASLFLKKHNVKPNFLNYEGFPGVICTSIDEEIVHGIPSNKRYLEEGQIISIDTGCIYKGMHADAARTFAVGKISEDKQKLINVAKESFFEAMKIIKPDIRIGDIGNTIQNYVEKNGFSVVRGFTGHGIGYDLHEAPMIPNYGEKGKGIRLRKNMTIAIEPMINLGIADHIILQDGWTAVTKDKKASAHYENTVLVTDNGVEILSLL